MVLPENYGVPDVEEKYFDFWLTEITSQYDPVVDSDSVCSLSEHELLNFFLLSQEIEIEEEAAVKPIRVRGSNAYVPLIPVVDSFVAVVANDNSYELEEDNWVAKVTSVNLKEKTAQCEWFCLEKADGPYVSHSDDGDFSLSRVLHNNFHLTSKGKIKAQDVRVIQQNLQKLKDCAKQNFITCNKTS